MEGSADDAGSTHIRCDLTNVLVEAIQTLHAGLNGRLLARHGSEGDDRVKALVGRIVGKLDVHIAGNAIATAASGECTFEVAAGSVRARSRGCGPHKVVDNTHAVRGRTGGRGSHVHDGRCCGRSGAQCPINRVVRFGGAVDHISPRTHVGEIKRGSHRTGRAANNGRGHSIGRYIHLGFEETNTGTARARIGLEITIGQRLDCGICGQSQADQQTSNESEETHR